MADAEPKDESACGCVGGEGGSLGAKVWQPQVDVRDPGADYDMAGRRAHQLRSRDRVDVDLGAEHRREPGVFGGAGYVADFTGSPSRAGNQPQSQFLCHIALLCQIAAMGSRSMMSLSERAQKAIPRRVTDHVFESVGARMRVNQQYWSRSSVHA